MTKCKLKALALAKNFRPTSLFKWKFGAEARAGLWGTGSHWPHDRAHSRRSRRCALTAAQSMAKTCKMMLPIKSPQPPSLRKAVWSQAFAGQDGQSCRGQVRDYHPVVGSSPAQGPPSGSGMGTGTRALPGSIINPGMTTAETPDSSPSCGGEADALKLMNHRYDSELN